LWATKDHGSDGKTLP